MIVAQMLVTKEKILLYYTKENYYGKVHFCYRWRNEQFG